MFVDVQMAEFDPIVKTGQAVPMLSPGITSTALDFLNAMGPLLIDD